MLFPKFIIENDRLVLSKVRIHREIAENIKNVKSGGWFLLKDNTFILYGASEDFGRASLEDIQKCVNENKIFSNKYSDTSLTEKYKFQYCYDLGLELTNLN